MEILPLQYKIHLNEDLINNETNDKGYFDKIC